MTERASRNISPPMSHARERYTNRRAGFTIVELLIVVVVIAILAAITVVSFTGIRQRAIETSLKSELSSAAKGFDVEQLGSGGTYDPTASAFLYRETTNGIIEYSYGNSQYYCMVARSKTNSTTSFYITTQDGGASSITSGACPAPNFRTDYRCVAGNLVSVYTFTNNYPQSITLNIAHAASGDAESFGFTTGQTRSGVTTLRVKTVARGVISFNVFDAATSNLLDRFYQSNPARSC